MRYVSDEASQRAREMEERLASLPRSSGILFVSVQPQPVEDGRSSVYFVRIGLARHFREEIGKALIKRVFETEMRSGLRIFAGVYRGVSGATR